MSTSAPCAIWTAAAAASLVCWATIVGGCGGDGRDATGVFPPDGRPQRVIDVEAAWAAPYVPTAARRDGFSVTIAATFPARAGALRVGRSLAGVLAESAEWLAGDARREEHSAHLSENVVPPLAPQEAAWLRSRGVPEPAGGIGWVGPGHTTAPPVQVVGSTVIVTDLKYVASYDERRPYANPLLSALMAAGAKVLVEGDLQGEGGVAANVTCTARPPVAARLAAELADYVALPPAYLARPPWHEDGLTPKQRQARWTYRFVVDEWTRRDRELLDDPRLTELALEAARSSPEEARRTNARLQKLLLEHTIEAFPDLEDEHLDPVVVSWLRADHERNVRLDEKADRDPSVLLRSPSADDLRVRAERDVRRGRHVGQLRQTRTPGGQAVPARGEEDDVLWYAEVASSDRRVDVAAATGPQVAVGFPSLVRYLHEHGCDRIAYDLFEAER